MGALSNSTMDNVKMDTTVTPFDSIKEIFGKAFGSLFNSNSNSNSEEYFSLKDKDVELNNKKIEINTDKEYLTTTYDASKYLGDSRAYQCNPSEHIVRNMSPYEFQTFLNGGIVEPIEGIQTVVLDRNGTNYCFSPETPVYLGDKLENTHQRMGREITPETIQNIIQEKYWGMSPNANIELNLSTMDFPEMENIQVVFQLSDTELLKDAVFRNCEGREGIDPCFSGSFGYGDNTDCEIRFKSYNQDMLTPIAIEGINVEGMPNDKIAELMIDLMNARVDGISIETFLENNPEYEARYDNSNIVSLDDYERADEKYKDEISNFETIEEWDEYYDDNDDIL